LAARALLDGRPAKVIMSYGKGLFNYASHLVDLAVDWFGEIASVQAFGDPRADHPSFCCRMAAGFDLLVVGMDGLGYDQFDVDIFLPGRKIAMHLGGCDRTTQVPVADRFYPGYAHLGAPVALAQSGPIGGMLELYRDIRTHLRTGAPLPGCTLEAAAHGVAVLEAVAVSRQSGHPVTPIVALDGSLKEGTR
jgi:predicted dehydrogenase